MGGGLISTCENLDRATVNEFGGGGGGKFYFFPRDRGGGGSKPEAPSPGSTRARSSD